MYQFDRQLTALQSGKALTFTITQSGVGMAGQELRIQINASLAQCLFAGGRLL